MKKCVSLWIGAVIYLAVSAMLLIMGHATTAPRPAPPRAPAAERPDATLMRPGFRIDTSAGMIRIHGRWSVLRPSGLGRDHDVAVRLTIARPDDGKELYAEELIKIPYHRAHGQKDYFINKEMKFDASGLDVKVAAVDLDDGREFGSIVTHGVAVEPAPGPRKGE